MNNRYSSLDGLRAYAAIGIILMHVLANLNVSSENNFVYEVLIPSLTNFVYLFFVISAFSLCCGYYEKMKAGQVSMNLFYKRRYQRVLPFFALLVLIDCIVPHGANKHELSTFVEGTVSTVTPWMEQLYQSFADLTLAFNLLPNADIKVIGVGWFLGLIFLFYMLFPFFVFMMDNKRRAWKSFAIMLAFCFVAIDYFYTPQFIDFEVTRHNIIYSAPFFGVGGLIYLYREGIVRSVKRYRYGVLIFAWVMTIGFWLSGVKDFWFVLAICALCAVWLIYAIGTEGKVLNNRFTKYLSGISMEVYLCHMMCFRAVEMAHLEKYIGQVDVLYVVTCLCTILIAILFSHVVKYYVLPKVETYLFKP
jgi:peptidoglycan/LPS O-acetylase OafA/YrhL